MVLMTDGIIEAHDAEDDMYGESGRLEQIVTGFSEDISAEAMVDVLIQDAIDYSGGNREDDCTVLVAKVN